MRLQRTGIWNTGVAMAEISRRTLFSRTLLAGAAIIGAGLGVIGLGSHLVDMVDFSSELALMIGLGVGIDYALFLVSRYRLERKDGKEIDDAIATAVSTSGTAIVFAGGTVVIALVSLLVAGIPLVTSLGYASAFAVVTAVVAAMVTWPWSW